MAGIEPTVPEGAHTSQPEANIGGCVQEGLAFDDGVDAAISVLHSTAGLVPLIVRMQSGPDPGKPHRGRTMRSSDDMGREAVAAKGHCVSQ